MLLQIACIVNPLASWWQVDAAKPKGIDYSAFDRYNNLCSIYAERPIWCNVDLYYDQFLATKMTQEDWYALNERTCAGLKLFPKE
jgi:Fe-S-cluster containining protein